MVTASDRFKSGNEYQPDPNILLVEMQEQGQTTVHRAALNNENITSNGETYIATNMQVNVPNSGDENQQSTISMSNVSRIPGQAVLGAKRRITVRTMNSARDDRDVLLQDTLDMMALANVSIDPRNISGDLVPRADVQMPYPFTKTDRNFMPGLWL